MKTVFLSFMLIWPPYCLVYQISLNHSQAEVMGRMNDGFHSDEAKRQIRDFKRRKELGLVETYKDATGKDLIEDRAEAARLLKEEENAAPSQWQIVPEEKNALGLLKRDKK